MRGGVDGGWGEERDWGGEGVERGGFVEAGAGGRRGVGVDEDEGEVGCGRAVFVVSVERSWGELCS